jgi:hypothetical protein
MKDLTNPAWIKFKGILFLFLGLISAMLLLLDHPSARVALLLAITIWCFCRFYYFAFYVIQHYVDPSYRFSGLCRLPSIYFAKRALDLPRLARTL